MAGMISFETSGDFKKTERFLQKLSRGDIFKALSSYGSAGVEALRSNTPVESGETAMAWSYEVKQSRGSWQIIWKNNHIVDGVPIAIILQYGHGTGTGGYVRGRDYINPAMKPVFDKIADAAWKAVTSA